MDLERFARNQPVTKGMSTEMNSGQEGRGLSAEKAVFLCVCNVPALHQHTWRGVQRWEVAEVPAACCPPAPGNWGGLQRCVQRDGRDRASWAGGCPEGCSPCCISTQSYSICLAPNLSAVWGNVPVWNMALPSL